MRGRSLSWAKRKVRVPHAHPARERLLKAAESASMMAMPELAVAEMPPTVEPPQVVEIPVPVLTDFTSAHERAEFLLHTAAEVEHALMAQYLCASFSLGPPFEGAVPADAVQLATRWRGLLLRTAREEMGHLMTVQNLLRLIGGRINLEREDFPFRKELYPFPFTLEPFAPVSLAKYIAAEMPEIENPTPEMQEIIALATQGAGMSVNRVGVLYALLTAIFSRKEEVSAFAASDDPWLSWVGLINEAANTEFAESEQHLGDEDFLPGTESAQASPEDWGGDSTLFVRVVRDRAEALAALREIALQGEGLPPGQGPPEDSHFQRFMDIHAGFPLQGQWMPARSIAVNPTLPRPGQPLTPNTITNPRSQKWARLFDLRYAILLMGLAHFLEVEGPLYLEAGPQKGDRTPRGYLHLWVFNEMRRLHKLGRKLSQLPRREDPLDGARAGAPFTLPLTLELPPGEPARWKLHRDNFEASLRLVDELLQAGSGDETDPFLHALIAADSQCLAIAESQMEGLALPAQTTDFQKVVHILDEAVRGLSIRRHGGFWRGINRDEFVALSVLGFELLVVGDGQSSNLIKVLRGELGALPRMPVARPPVPRPRIEFIKEWIDSGCPDNDPPGAIGIAPEPDPLSEPSP